MRFFCQKCGAKYQIQDEKIAGRTVVMLCRKCDSPIALRGVERDGRLELKFDDLNPAAPERAPRRRWTQLAQLYVKRAAGAEDEAERVALHCKAAETYAHPLGKHGDAAEQLEKALELRPDDREIMLRLSDQHVAAKRYSEAIDVLRSVVETYRGRRSKALGDVHHRIATAYVAMDERDAALEELEVARKMDPGSVKVLADLGVLSIEMAARAEAAEDKRQHLKRAGNNIRSLLLQKLDESAPLTKAEVFYWLAETCRLEQNDAKAIQMCERALANDPTLEKAAELLAKLKDKEPPKPLFGQALVQAARDFLAEAAPGSSEPPDADSGDGEPESSGDAAHSDDEVEPEPGADRGEPEPSRVSDELDDEDEPEAGSADSEPEPSRVSDELDDEDELADEPINEPASPPTVADTQPAGPLGHSADDQEEIDRADASSPTDELPAGTIVDGKFTIMRVLGRGGMGLLYLASEHITGVDAVLKTVRPDLATDKPLQERLAREAQALARIDHPNVVPVKTVIQERVDGGSRLWLVMPYVEGESLADVIQRHRGIGMSRDEVLVTLRQIVAGVQAAHDRGILHRDLKPANVLIRSKDGAVKVADFGMALLPEASTAARRLTEPGAVIGTCNYASPEQLLAKPLNITTDTYALGVILWEMLTGEVPFDGDTKAAVIDAVLNRELAPPSKHREDLTEAIDAVLKTACDKKPERRFRNCSDLLDATERALASAGKRRRRAKRRAARQGSAPPGGGPGEGGPDGRPRPGPWETEVASKLTLFRSGAWNNRRSKLATRLSAGAEMVAIALVVTVLVLLAVYLW